MKENGRGDDESALPGSPAGVHGSSRDLITPEDIAAIDAILARADEPQDDPPVVD